MPRPTPTAPRPPTPPKAKAEVAEGPAPAPRRGASAAASGQTRTITHAERVVDASTGLTKGDVVRYYEAVAAWLLPHLAERPLALVRAPQGIGGQLFFQKHPTSGHGGRLPGVRALDPALWPEHAALMVVDDADGLLGAAQMNVLEFHTWNATTRAIDMPDRMVFDLDPGDGVDWPQMQEAAVCTREALAALGLKSWLKTSGGKGLHVVVPLVPRLGAEAVKAVSHAVVQHMATTHPGRFVAKAGADNRVGRVFIDFLRNGLGQTTVAAFSLRARPGLGVSMPLAWEQLGSIDSGAAWTLSTALEHLASRSDDPWAGYRRSRQTLARAVRELVPGGMALADGAG